MKKSDNKFKKFFKAIGKFFKIVAVAIYKFLVKFFVSIFRFIVLTFRQVKKVRWPDKKTMVESTIVVVAFVVFLGLYFMFDDFIILNLLKLIKY